MPPVVYECEPHLPLAREELGSLLAYPPETAMLAAAANPQQIQNRSCPCCRFQALAAQRVAEASWPILQVISARENVYCDHDTTIAMDIDPAILYTNIIPIFGGQFTNAVCYRTYVWNFARWC